MVVGLFACLGVIEIVEIKEWRLRFFFRNLGFFFSALEVRRGVFV